MTEQHGHVQKPETKSGVPKEWLLYFSEPSIYTRCLFECYMICRIGLAIVEYHEHLGIAD